MCFWGSGSEDYSEDARVAEAQRQARIKQGMSAIEDIFRPFDTEFYNQRSQAYTDYYMPQLEQQYGDSRDQLTYGLARNGILASSAGAQKLGDLSRIYNENQASIADKARAAASAAKSDIEKTRTELQSQLAMTSDPTTAAQAATSRAAALSTPEAFTPLSNVFSDILGNYAMRVNAARQGYANPGGWFSIGNGSGSSSVVNS